METSMALTFAGIDERLLQKEKELRSRSRPPKSRVTPATTDAEEEEEQNEEAE